MMNLIAQINDIVEKCRNEGSRAVVALDGMSASGKTTLAAELAQKFEGAVIHTDDFHLPFPLRTEERRAEPGGNLDYERFAKEVLPFLKERRTFSYGCFSCREGKIVRKMTIDAECPLIIVEGAYSMRPEFRSAYDLSVCMVISKELQRERLIAREGTEKFKTFEELWIPLEKRYIEYYNLPEICDIIVKTEKPGKL